MVTIYHNPRCSKSRACLSFLSENNIEYTLVDYLKNGITIDELRDLVKKTGVSVFSLVRTHEDYYKNELKGKDFTDEEWLKILVENPKLLHRPIVISGNRGVLAQPAEKINDII